MVNQFIAYSKAREALEAQGCVVRSCIRKPQRPVITAECMTGHIPWPVVEVVVKEKGVQRVVCTSRINDCQVIWN
ncbi:hypothetical protein [Enterobacter ludwigii]|uniref:hypothetical protein n=1 Tax=Enterobacter ludwigii TaxID=299767 RepID=UPI0013D214E5|nr:hypothetical protein [Enterobacter ludwigii]